MHTTRDSSIDRYEKNEKQRPGKKSPRTEKVGQDQHTDSYEFKSITKLHVLLREARYRHEGHREYHVGT